MKKVALIDYRQINSLPSGMTTFLDGMKEFTFVNSNFVLEDGVLKDVDAVLLYDATDVHTFCKKQKVVGCSRLAKHDQQIFLTNVYQNNIPTLCIKRVAHDWRISMTKVVVDFMKRLGTPVLLKISEGARGLGQKLISDSKECHKFFELLRYYKEQGIKTLNEEQASQLGIEQLGSEQFLQGNFIVQPYIDFYEEYRVLAFYKQKPLIAKRKRKVNEVTGIVTANIRGDNENEIVPPGVLAYATLDQLSQKLLKATNSPWLSIDYGTTSMGRVFCLEFQMQAGISSFKFEDVQEKTQKSFLAKMGWK